MITLYVNTSAGSNGDGSAGNPYNSLANALIAGNSPVTRGDNVTINIYGANATSALTTIAASYTSATRQLYIVGNRTLPYWDTAAHRFTVTNTNCLNLGGYVHLDKLQIQVTSSGFANIGVFIQEAGNTWLSNSILRGTGSLTGQSYHSALEACYNGASNVYAWNNIIYDFVGTGYSCGLWNHMAANAYFYNNTVYNCAYGIVTYQANDLTTAINNIVVGCSTANYANNSFYFTPVSKYNTSSDATVPYIYPTDISNLINQTVNFNNAASRVLTLASPNTSVLNNAQTLETDTYIPFAVDIVGTSRPQNSAWDRGAWELPASTGRTVTGSHTLGGMTQSGSLNGSVSRLVSGSQKLTGLTHSGNLTNTSLVSKLSILSHKRMWLAHQSVGNYITHGPADDNTHGIGLVASANPGYITLVRTPANVAAIPRGYWGDTYNGSNYYPYGKVSAFNTAIRSTFSDGHLDFAVFKFCWVDFYLSNSEIKTTGDADTFWTTYKSTMDALITDFTLTKFILCTVPVTPNNSDGGNSLREYFSAKIRTEYSGRGLVFDLADFESRDLNKNLVLSGGYRQLYNSWDGGDGGHPNNAGSDMLAYELITKLSGIAQNINIVEGSHSLNGLTQSGTVSSSATARTVSGGHTLSGLSHSGLIRKGSRLTGNHTFAGMVHTGALTNTAPVRVLSGNHILTGLLSSGSITTSVLSRIISGGHTLSGLSHSGLIRKGSRLTGNHTFAGMVQSGTLVNTAPERTISGTHNLSGLHTTGIIIIAGSYPVGVYIYIDGSWRRCY